MVEKCAQFPRFLWKRAPLSLYNENCWLKLLTMQIYMQYFLKMKTNRHYKRNVDLFSTSSYFKQSSLSCSCTFLRNRGLSSVWSQAASFSLLALRGLCWVSMSTISSLRNLPSLSHTQNTHILVSLFPVLSHVLSANTNKIQWRQVSLHRDEPTENQDPGRGGGGGVHMCVSEAWGEVRGLYVVFCLCEEKLWTKLIASFNLRLSCLFSLRDLFYLKDSRVSLLMWLSTSVRPRQIGKTGDYSSLIYVSNFQCQSSPPAHTKVGHGH